jgi:hypothetical protein
MAALSSRSSSGGHGVHHSSSHHNTTTSTSSTTTTTTYSSIRVPGFKPRSVTLYKQDARSLIGEGTYGLVWQSINQTPITHAYSLVGVYGVQVGVSGACTKWRASRVEEDS